MKQEIEAGDYVRVKCGKDTESHYGINTDMRDMEKETKLKVQSVSSFDSNLIRVYEKDERITWNFHINDITLVEKANGKEIKEKSEMENNKYTVIFNGPATILFVDRMIGCEKEKYVAKAYNEEFDAEKGLALALLKSFGISYLDFKRILATAKKQSKKKEEPICKDKKETEDVALDLTHLIDTVTESPRGKHRGKPYQFKIGDIVIVRDCYSYSHEIAEDIKDLLNQELEISDVYLTDTAPLYAINYLDKRYVFSGSELEPVFED